MTNLAEKGQYRVGFTPEPPGASPTPRLTTLEIMPLTAGVSDLGGVRAMVEQVEHWAAELLDPGRGDHERRRVLARMIAAVRAKLALRETQREQALSGGEFMAALVVDKLVQADARRLCALLRELRAECRGETRPVRVSVVAAGDRPQVNILAGAAR